MKRFYNTFTSKVLPFLAVKEGHYHTGLLTIIYRYHQFYAFPCGLLTLLLLMAEKSETNLTCTISNKDIHTKEYWKKKKKKSCIILKLPMCCFFVFQMLNISNNIFCDNKQLF